MSKTIVLCTDGTWNGPADINDPDAANTVNTHSRTNVYKLFANLAGDQPADPDVVEQERTLTAGNDVVQIAKYLHGVGNSDNPLVKMLGGSVGAGLVTRIVRGYTFISRNYQPGDRIVLVGFSRGAYTARALAGLIAAKGLLNPVSCQSQTNAYRQGIAVWYDYVGDKPHNLPKSTGILAHLFETTVDFAERMLAAVTDAPRDLVAVDAITAVGVWDTVGAMGVPVTNKGERVDVFDFTDNRLSPTVKNGFHAISVDEQRVDFTPSVWEARDGVTQVLFPGAHADVGGGYPMAGADTPPWRNECGLSDSALEWMQDQLSAPSIGVVLAPAMTFTPAPDAGGMAHQPWLGTVFSLGARRFLRAQNLVLAKALAQRKTLGGVGIDPSNQQGFIYAPMNLPLTIPTP